MNDPEKQTKTAPRPPLENAPEASYPSAVESLSSKWRTIQTTDAPDVSRSFFRRNPIALGIGIGVGIVLFLAIVGGFLLLVWTVNR